MFELGKKDAQTRFLDVVLVSVLMILTFFFLRVFQVAEDKTMGLLQAPCTLGMNTFVTGPLQHEVLVM